jgi:hypothetical protein
MIAPKDLGPRLRTSALGVRRPRAPSASALLHTIGVAALLIATHAGCGDPIRDNAVDALGPEARGVPVGPLHRPGQPCVLCHGETAEAPTFSFAGTVYVDATSLTPIDDVTVTLIDLFGREFSTTTNCAGNFFVRPREYPLDGPIWVGLRRDEVLREMDTPIFRDGSCTGCHDDPAGPASAGHVYLIDDPVVEKAPISRCP